MQGRLARADFTDSIQHEVLHPHHGNANTEANAATPPTPAPSPEPTYIDSAGDSFTCGLIAKHIGGTLFDSKAKHTCLMNEDGTSSETYMKLGNLVSS